MQLPLATIDVNFDAPVNIASAAPTDLVLSRGSATGVSLLDADTLRFTITRAAHR